MKGDGRYPEYPSVGVDDDVGGLVVLMGDGVERPDVAFPHFLGGEVNALHAAVLRLVPLQPIVVPSLRIKERSVQGGAAYQSQGFEDKNNLGSSSGLLGQ